MRIFPILFLVILVACSGEEDSTSQDLDKPESAVETVKSSAEYGEVKIDQMRDSVEKVQMAVSPFLKEGCCEEEERKAETCCCEAVYDKYKSMLEEKRSDLVEIGMTDPILAGCRKLMPIKFDQLENPPSEEPDELDELFN